MNLEIKKNNEQVSIIMGGSLDTQAAEQVDNQIKEAEEAATLPVLIDCTNLDYIASAGLRLLLRIRKAASANGQKVTLLNANDSIKEVLSITHFDKMFVMQP